VTDETTRRRFTEQVLPHLDDAYSLARWLTGNATDAEDVVQEACLRAMRALEGAPVESPRAWLLAITRNTAFTWLAKNRPHLLVLAGGEEEARAHQGALEEQSPPARSRCTPRSTANLTRGAPLKWSARSRAIRHWRPNMHGSKRFAE
jgi:RNA polymerase sigma-70 factor (ECF subfamily)